MYPSLNIVKEENRKRGAKFCLNFFPFLEICTCTFSLWSLLRYKFLVETLFSNWKKKDRILSAKKIIWTFIDSVDFWLYSSYFCQHFKKLLVAYTVYISKQKKAKKQKKQLKSMQKYIKYGIISHKIDWKMCIHPHKKIFLLLLIISSFASHKETIRFDQSSWIDCLKGNGRGQTYITPGFCITK